MSQYTNRSGQVRYTHPSQQDWWYRQATPNPHAIRTPARLSAEGSSLPMTTSEVENSTAQYEEELKAGGLR